MTTLPARPTYPLSEPELNALYLRLAAAFRRLEARRAARVVSAERLPLPLGEGQGEGLPLGESAGDRLPLPSGEGQGEGGGSRRGPYRRRDSCAAETGRGKGRTARPVNVTAPGRA